MLLLGCVVAFARLYLPVLVVGPYFDFAEGAVLVGIGGCVADRVLAPHLVLKLAECVLQGHLPVDMEYVAAGFLRPFWRIVFHAVSDSQLGHQDIDRGTLVRLSLQKLDAFLSDGDSLGASGEESTRFSPAA